MSLAHCAACGAPGLKTQADGTRICRFCGRSYGPEVQSCPACGTLHSAQADTCPGCGEPLSIAARVLSRGIPRPRWLERTRSQAAALQALEERASQARMAGMQRVEQVRLEQDRLAQLAEERRWRAIFLWGALGLLALLSLLALVGLWLSMAG